MNFFWILGGVKKKSWISENSLQPPPSRIKKDHPLTGNGNPCIILVKFSRYFLDLTMNLDLTFFGFNAMFRNSTKFYHKLSRIKHFMSHRLAQSPSCQIGLKLFFVLILAVSNHLDGILCLISRRPLDWMKTKMRIGWWWCYRWIEQSAMMASMC